MMNKIGGISMNIYLKNVLRGFIDKRSDIELTHATREGAEFLVVDLDQDDMPEIVICFKEKGVNYIGVLAKRENKWVLEEIKEDDDEDGNGIKGFVDAIENDKLGIDAIGNTFKLEELFNKLEARFISIINEEMYFGNIVLNRKKDDGFDNEVLNLEQADVFGTGLPDTIYLVGDRPYGEASQLVEDLQLIIKEGSTGQNIEIDLPVKKGYYPTLFVKDFTGDKRNDILVTVYTGEEGGGINSYLYTFENNRPILIFDSERFNEQNTGLVEYKDNYKVEITVDNPPKKYILDVSQSDDEYLVKIYDKDGNLIEESYGEILGLNSLNPVDYQNSGIYNLDAIQRIIGPELTDTLGLLETFLVWDKVAKEFKPFIQYVSLYGKPSTTKR